MAEDALELVEVDYEPLEPVVDPLVAAERADDGLRAALLATAMPTRRSRDADLVVRERFRFPRWSGVPLECYGVVADWNEAAGTLTAWANFQGPFTLHSVAAARARAARAPSSG